MNSSIYLRTCATFLLITALITVPHAAGSQQSPKPQATQQQSAPQQTAPKPVDTKEKPTPAPAPSATPAPSVTPVPSPPAASGVPAATPNAPKNVEASPAQDVSPQNSSAKLNREDDSTRFEKLIADESFMIVGEMRALNQYMQSPLAKEIFAMYSQLDETPKEVRLLQDFAARNGDALDSARISFAIMPMRPNLPQMLFGVQFTDERTARELTPQLRRLVAEIATAATANFRQGTTAARPTTEEPKKNTDAVAETTAKTETVAKTEPVAKADAAKPGATTPATGRVAKDEGYFVKQIGSLLLMSEKEFKLEDLKPAAAALSLAENPRYQQVQAQFGSESSVVFYDLKLVEREFKRMMKDQQEIAEKAQAEAKAAEAETSGTESKVVTISDDAPPSPDEEATTELTAVEVTPPSPTTETEEADEKNEPEEGATLTTDSMLGADSGASVAIPSLGMIFPAMFGGGLTQILGGAEALGIGASLESDAASVRLLFATPEKKSINPIPFLPMVIAGQPATPRAAAMLPADTDVFFSMSVDLSQTYDEMLGIADKAMQMRTESGDLLRDLDAPINGAQAGDVKPAKSDALSQVSPSQLAITMIEQRYGFKIKDELLTSLGSELAFGVLHAKPPAAKDAASMSASAGASAKETSVKDSPADMTEAKKDDDAPQSANGGYVLLASVTDRERLKRLLPLALEAAGMRLPNVANFAFQKRGDAEFITFALGSAAFIGDYLVIAPDALTLDRIVEIAGGGSSLATKEEFIAARAWQPREKLAEVFVAGGVIETLFAGERQQLVLFDESIKAFFAAHESAPQPLSYVSTGDPQGTLHEIRIPRSLILSFTAQAVVDAKHGEKLRNERFAASILQTLASAQAAFRATEGGEKRYGTLEELRKAQLIGEYILSPNGYTLKFNVSADKFDATATPDVYNVTGRRSFYIDDTSSLRAADHGGRPATAADPEVK